MLSRESRSSTRAVKVPQKSRRRKLTILFTRERSFHLKKKEKVGAEILLPQKTVWSRSWRATKNGFRLVFLVLYLKSILSHHPKRNFLTMSEPL